jgi:O-antigen/teichoic acid export membrane protein
MLRRNVVVSYLGQGWAALMALAFLPFYARTLGMEAYGLVGVFSILQAWMALLDLGLTPTLNREMARLTAGVHTADSIRDLLRSLEIVYAGVACIMVLGLWVAAPFLGSQWLSSRTLPDELVTSAVRVMGLVLAARWLEQIYRGALQGIQDLLWLNAAQVVLSTFRWGGACLLLMKFPSIKAFLAWQGVSSVISFVVLAWRTYRKLPPKSRRTSWGLHALKPVKTFAGGMFAGTLLSLLLTNSDKIIISRLSSLDALGLYTLASSVVAGLLQFVLPMNTAVYPRLTEQVARGDTSQLKSTYLLSCEWLAAIVVPPALVLTFFADAVMIAWTGDNALADSVAPILSILALGTLCNGLMNLPYMLQLAHGWTGLAVRVNTVAVLVIVPVLLFAVPRFGGVGAASAWLLLNFAYLVIVAHLMHRRILPTIKWKWYTNAVVLPLVAGVASASLLRVAFAVPGSRSASMLILAVAGSLITATVWGSLPAVRGMVGGLVKQAFAARGF